MNYFSVCVYAVGVVVTGTDKKGEVYTYRDDNIIDTPFAPNGVFTISMDRILPESEVDTYIEGRKKWFENKENRFLEKKFKDGGFDIPTRKLPEDWKIKTITSIRLDIQVKKKNMKECSVETCLKRMTVEQFIDCFGSILQLKLG